MAVSSWCPSSAFLYLLLWISMETDLLQGLRIISCIFFPLTNFSCTWDAEEGVHLDSNFTLNVTQVLGSCGEKYMEALTCRTSSPHMSCSVLVYSLHSYYRISVSAESKMGHTESPFICLLGIEAVKLSPPRIKNISSASGQSNCLLVDWDPLTYSQISNLAHATYEMEYQAVDQENSRVQKTVVPFAVGYTTLKPVKQCNFSANTKYAIRLRSRYRSNMSHWSDWSEERMAETPESAPSLAPQLWRHITHHDPSGNRRVLLLWKPLQRQHENGRILGFRLSYLREGGTERAFFPGCSSSDSLSTSCTVDLPAEAYTIFLKAYNHKGESPEATITIPAFNQTDLPAPLAVTVSSASDHSLLIWWAPSKDPSVTGYVLEWCVVSQNITCRASWQRLSWQTTETVITENIEPERMYNVSVYILYNAVAGQPFSQQGYSRQGAPSCGPTLTPLAAKTSGVYLTWKPLPLDERRGFIRNYKIVYSSKDSNLSSIMVNSSVHSLLLKGLFPNKVYTFFAEAITDGGSTSGPSLLVKIDVNDEQWTVLFPILLTVTLLLLMIGILTCVQKMEILQKLLWPPVPDPGHSSLAHWMPKIFLDLGGPQEQYSLKAETDVSVNHKDISGTIQLLAGDKFNVDLLGGHFKAGLSGEGSRMQSDVYPTAINCISEQGLCPTSIIFGDHCDEGKRPAITEQVEYSAIIANGYMGLAGSPNPAVHVPLLPSLGTENAGVLG